MRRCNFSSLVLDQPRLLFSAGTNVSFMGSLATDVPGHLQPFAMVRNAAAKAGTAPPISMFGPTGCERRARRAPRYWCKSWW